MKKEVKIIALTGNNETIFVDNYGDLYSVKKNKAEFILNSCDECKNPLKKAIISTVAKLQSKGYNIAQEFTKEAYNAFKTARKLHRLDAQQQRDFLFYGLFND